jgi:LPXTG-site transpeptidase (sortase) family protein
VTLRKFNNGLNIVVLLLAVYILVLPFLPLVQLKAKQVTDKNGGYAYQSALAPNAPNARPIPQDNRLVIPSLFFDQPVQESKSISVINNGGTWRRPKTSNPTQDGNTVIVGHRYTYKGASVFYNLDQLKVGDKIIVYWEGKEHDYQVSETKVVAPSAGEIERQTDEKILTIYTCTPMWNAKNRLVIIAKPIGENS